MFFDLLQLLKGFLYWRDHKNKQTKKECSSTEQASNETVAKNFLEVPFIKSRQKILPYHRESTLNP